MKNLLFIETKHKREYLYKAKKLGYNIIVAEKNFNNFDNIADSVIDVDVSNYDELLTKVIDFNNKKHIDGVITVHEHAVEAVSLVANCLNLPGLDFRGAVNCRNKFITRNILSYNNIVQPKFILTNDADIENDIEQIGYPCIVKPLKYSGSSAVIKISNKYEKQQMLKYVRLQRKNSSCKDTLVDTLPSYWMIEEYIDGFEISVQAITYKGRTHIITIHDKVVPMDGPEFAEEYILTPSPRIDKILEEKIVQTSKNILEAINFNFGVSHLEFRISNNIPILLEVNGRLGGGTTNDIIYYSTGIDLFNALTKICIGEEPNILKKYSNCVAVKRVQLNKGIIKDISGFEEAKNIEGVRLVKQWMNIGDVVRTTTRDVGGAVLAVSNNSTNALKSVEEAVSKIHFVIE